MIYGVVNWRCEATLPLVVANSIGQREVIKTVIDTPSRKPMITNPLKRGEVWLADLNPTQGSEQAGIPPVIIFQNDLVSQFSTTIIAIPLTTNQRRAALPICLLIEQG